MHLENAFECQL